MSIPKAILSARGSWHGKSQLHLSFLPPDKQTTESSSTLHVDSDRQETFATITYDWEYEGKREEGSILLCAPEKSNRVEIGWVDSWHQNGAVMHLVGESADEKLKTKGSYQADGQTWGWTIEFEVSKDHLVLRMVNVSPSGQEDWAVHATYERA